MSLNVYNIYVSVIFRSVLFYARVTKSYLYIYIFCSFHMEYQRVNKDKTNMTYYFKLIF